MKQLLEILGGVAILAAWLFAMNRPISSKTWDRWAWLAITLGSALCVAVGATLMKLGIYGLIGR